VNEAVICSPVRSAIGRYGGILSPVTAAELAATVISALVKRTGIPLDAVDDVILGHCYPNGEAPAIGRVAALDAGLPVDIPGQQVDRRCGSGLQAVVNAAMAVQTGVAGLIIAGGAESMSNVPFYSTDVRWGAGRTGATLHDGLVRARQTAGGRHHPVAGGMIETAENLRREFKISREAQDALAVQSHKRAVAAQRAGIFDQEIVGVTVNDRRSEHLVSVDEHPRADTTMESLAALRPIMLLSDPDATVTAGNASGQNDAAAVCVVTTSQTAERLGLQPLMALRSWAVAGVAVERMGIGPVPATEMALARAGIGFGDLDVIELNEAFAAQALAVLATWGIEQTAENVNPHGSGISLGHPTGATGARLVGSLARELDRRQGRFGLVSLCIGGGQGISAVFERTP
jgi:acetyl-CoA C-acetyltransferase